MDDLFGFFTALMHPKAFGIILLIGAILGVPYYVGTRVGQAQNVEVQNFRGLSKAIRQCEEKLPRDQRCSVDWSKAVTFTEKAPTTAAGKVLDWAKTR